MAQYSQALLDDVRNAVDIVDLVGRFVNLRKAGVNAEVHIYNRGGHGFGVRSDRPDYAISSWPARFVDWLGDLGMLKK